MGFMEEICRAAAVPFSLGNLICESPTLESCVDATGLALMDDEANLSDFETKSMVDSVSDGNKDCNLGDRESELSASVLSVSQDNKPREAALLDMNSEHEGNCIAGDSVGRESEEDDFLSVEGDCSLSVVSDSSSLCGDDLLAYEAISEILVPNFVDAESNLCNVEVDAKPGPLRQSNVGEILTDSVALTVGIEEEIAEGSSTKSSTIVVQLPPKDGLSAVVGRSVFEVDCVPLWGIHSVCGRRPEMEDAFMAVPRFLKIPLQMLIGDRDVDKTHKYLSHLTTHFFGVYDGHGGSQVPLSSSACLPVCVFVCVCILMCLLPLCCMINTFVCRLQIIAAIAFILCWLKSWKLSWAILAMGLARRTAKSSGKEHSEIVFSRLMLRLQEKLVMSL